MNIFCFIDYYIKKKNMLSQSDCDKRGIRFFVNIPYRFYTDKRIICFLGHKLVRAYHNDKKYNTESKYVAIDDDIFVKNDVLTEIVRTIDSHDSLRFDVHVEAVQRNNQILFENIIGMDNIIENNTMSRISQRRKLIEQDAESYKAENTNRRMMELDNIMRNRRKIQLEQAEKDVREAERKAKRIEAIRILEDKIAQKRELRFRGYLERNGRKF